MTDCVDPRGNAYLSLTLTENMRSRTEKLDDFDIAGAQVWAFDKMGGLVSSAAAEPNADGLYEAWMNLPAGDYNFIAWTGDGNTYKVANTSNKIDEMVLFLDRSDEEAITEMIPDLLYGRVTGRSIVAGANNTVNVAMTLDTYNINVTARELEQNSDIWAVSIYKPVTYFMFDHSLMLGDRMFHHMRTGSVTGEGRLSASMRIVAPGTDGNPRLVLHNVSTGNVLYDMNLEETIIDAYSTNGQTIDFEHTYDYDIVLTVSAALGVTVSVNGWEYETEPSELK
jgi:hypothetical protein